MLSGSFWFPVEDVSHRCTGVMKLVWPAWVRKEAFVKARAAQILWDLHKRSRHTYPKEARVHTSGTDRYAVSQKTIIGNSGPDP